MTARPHRVRNLASRCDRSGDPVRSAVDALGDEFVIARLDDADDLAQAMVDQLLQGHVVAIHDGPSESGPRALGHRTILADPRRRAMQDYINFEVKGSPADG